MMEYKLEHLDYEITKACNLSCVHCSALAGEGEKPEVELIKKVLREGKELGLRRLGITGGEPFLFPEELGELVDFAFDELGCPVHIHSNGSYIIEDIDLILKRVKKIENLTLTLLGYEEVHDLNCGEKGVYDQLKLVVDELAGSSLPLNIFLIPMANNFEGLVEGAKEFYELGARRFRVMKLSSGGKAKENYGELRLSKEQKERFILELKGLGEEGGIKFEAGYCTRLSYKGLGSLRYHDACNSGVNRLHIDGEGYVFPCTAASGFLEMKVGELKERSLREIWTGSEELKEYRERAVKGCKVQEGYEKSG